MAIAFELVMNFGDDRAAVERARPVILDHPGLTAGDHRIPLHEPLLNTAESRYLELSVLPVAVGHGVVIDNGRPRLPLTPDELDELGFGLYDLLRQITGYRAAMVGKNPESLVDTDELRTEWTAELTTGRMPPGLVLADDLYHELHGSGFTRFAPGYVWIPYRGERRP